MFRRVTPGARLWSRRRDVATPLQKGAQPLPDAVDTVHDYVGLGGDLRRSLLARDADAQDLLKGPFLTQRHQLPEGVEVCGVVPDEHGLLGTILLDQGAYRRALVSPDGGARLDDPSPDRDYQAQPLAFALHELHGPIADLGWRVAVVDGGGDALLLHERAEGLELPPGVILQLLHPLAVRQGLGGHLYLAVAQDLEAVVAEVDDIGEPDEVERVLGLAAAYARHEAIPLAQPPEKLLELGRHLGHVRRRHDGGQRAVYVGEDRHRPRRLTPGLESLANLRFVPHAPRRIARCALRAPLVSTSPFRGLISTLRLRLRLSARRRLRQRLVSI